MIMLIVVVSRRGRSLGANFLKLPTYYMLGIREIVAGDPTVEYSPPLI
jgi:hypothetical protein